MSQVLGSLLVKVGLDAAEFTSGLTRSEYQAKQFANKIQDATAQATKLFAVVAGFGSAAAFAGIISGSIEAKARLADLSTQTNISVEALSSLGKVGRFSNTSLDDIASASNKLSKALFSQTEDSKGAAQAIAALGLNFNDFKALAPEQQMLTVAKALEGFANTSEKSAAAMFLFGKQGAELLPFLKELAERGLIATKETLAGAEAAKQYEDNLKTLTAAGEEWKKTFVAAILPGLVSITRELVEGRKAYGGYFGAILDLGTTNPFNSLGENIQDVGGKLEAARGQLEKMKAAGQDGIYIAGKRKSTKTLEDEIALLEKRQRYFLAIQREEALDLGRGIGDDPRTAIRKPRLVLPPAPAGNAVAERVSEAQRYLETLTKQFEKTQDLTVVEQVLLDIGKKRIDGITPGIEKEILGVARLIDLHKADAESLKAMTEAGRKAAEAATKVTDEYTTWLRSVETPADTLIRRLEEIDKLTRNNALVGSNPVLPALLQNKAWNDYAATIKTTTEQADSFTKRFAENAQDYLGNGLYDVLSGNFKNIGSAFTSMINRMIAEAASAKISQYLFGDLVKGGSGSGAAGGFLDGVFNLLGLGGSRPTAFSPGGVASSGFGTGLGFGNLDFGGFLAGGGPAEPNTLYRVAERGPELLDVNGRSFLMMGNQRGTVTPNDRLGGGSPVYYSPTFILDQPASRDTQAQLAQAAMRGMRQAQRIS